MASFFSFSASFLGEEREDGEGDTEDPLLALTGDFFLGDLTGMLTTSSPPKMSEFFFLFRAGIPRLEFKKKNYAGKAWVWD